MALDIVGGGVVTARDTSDVVEILPLVERVQISDENAAEISQAARSLRWARIFHMPDTTTEPYPFERRTPSWQVRSSKR